MVATCHWSRKDDAFLSCNLTYHADTQQVTELCSGTVHYIQHTVVLGYDIDFMKNTTLFCARRFPLLLQVGLVCVTVGTIQLPDVMGLLMMSIHSSRPMKSMHSCRMRAT